MALRTERQGLESLAVYAYGERPCLLSYTANLTVPKDVPQQSDVSSCGRRTSAAIEQLLRGKEPTESDGFVLDPAAYGAYMIRTMLSIASL